MICPRCRERLVEVQVPMAGRPKQYKLECPQEASHYGALPYTRHQQAVRKRLREQAERQIERASHPLLVGEREQWWS